MWKKKHKGYNETKKIIFTLYNTSQSQQEKVSHSMHCAVQ